MRQWLKALPQRERNIIGADIMTVQFRWPLGMPLVDNLGVGIWEIRSKLPTRIARVLFFVKDEELILLHGFIKKTQKTLPEDRALALKQKMPSSKAAKNRNKHRGSSFRDFLEEDGILEEVEAAALKRALALKVADLMEKRDLNRTTMAVQMRTSRAAINRILDPENTSVTLTTLSKVAKSLGRKLKIDLVPA